MSDAIIGVNLKHPQYTHWESEWEKCRDCFDGQRAVKAKGTKYLPKLSGQSVEDYAAYKFRALFYSITSKSISSLVGMVTNKIPKLAYPPEMSHIFEDKSGVQFYEQLTTCLTENLLVSRFGLLVDRALRGGKVNVFVYTAENILNWDLDEDGAPQRVILQETVTVSGANRYEKTTVLQYRVLELLTNGAGELEYHQTVINHAGQAGKPIKILNTGKSMNFIPFFVVNSLGVDFKVVKPSMLDVSDVNISHYNTSADLENGRHFVGVPTPIITGASSDKVLRVGGTEAWIIPDKDAKAYYLEFNGSGLQSLEKALKEKEAQLASMSAKMMSSGNGSEAAETVRLRYMSETASLSSITRAVEAGLNMAYKTAAVMEGLSPSTVSVRLDKEFLSTRMQPAELLKLTESYLSGGMSVEAYVFNLRRGDQFPIDRTDEQEIASLKEAKAAIEALSAKNIATKPSSDQSNQA